MKQRIAETKGLTERFCLQYDVVGDEENGYGIEITLIEDGNKTTERCSGITNCYFYAKKLAKELASEAVFPVYLEDIVRDVMSDWKVF